MPPACWRATSGRVARRSGSISRRCLRAQVISGEIELIALGINDDVDAPADAFGLGLGGEAFGAADAEEFHLARELPALRQRDGRTNARVGAGPEANGQAFDLRAVELRVPQGLLHQAQRIRGALPVSMTSDKPAARRCRRLLDYRDAALRRGELKCQNLHR